MPTLFSGNRIIGATKALIVDKKEEEKIEKTIPIHTASTLLESKKYQALITQCTQLLDFTPDQAETYLTPLIESFAEFVQNLPETRNSYFSKPGGFIDHSLMRTASALSMCRAYFTADKPDQNNTRLTSTEILWMYALFAASIFNGIGKVFSDLIVELYDETGKHVDRWSPFEGNMLETRGQAYDYDFEEARNVDLFSRRLSVILAKQLIPFKGFAWISSEKEVLSLWLALLEDNQRDAGTLGPFLVRADALAINTYFDERRLQREYTALDTVAKDETDLIAKEKDEIEEKFAEEKEKFIINERDKNFFKSSLPTHDNNKLSEKRSANTQAGIEFLKWLTNELKSKHIEFNKSVFYMPGGAIVLPTAIFEEFRKKHPYYTSPERVIESFNKLQLHEKGTQENDIHVFLKQEIEAGRHKMESNQIEGIVLNNSQIVLPQTVSAVLPNNTRQDIKSSELQNNMHLLTPLQPVGKAELALLATKTPAVTNVAEANLKNFFKFGR